MNPNFASLPTSIFEQMSGLAREHDAVNLGQGFPDFGWPDDILERASDALLHGSNQYAPMRGLPELRQAVADHYRRHSGTDFAAEEVIITSGATEALASAIFALVEPGDEVVLFEPLYDAYLPLVRQAGGVPRLIALSPPDWTIREEALREAFSDRTKLVIFNNPHNPTSRVFGEEELRLLAECCVRHDTIALTDEVWEHLVFDGVRHIPLSTLPDMRDRTVKVGSAGKIFSLTGWKVGWIVAPVRLLDPISKAHQFMTFATPPNLQAAVAYGLGKDGSYFDGMRARFAESRDTLEAGLSAIGYATLPAQGTYFLCVDLARSGVEADDVIFCERAVKEAGVAAIPVSALFEGTPPRSVIRLCFAKHAGTIDQALMRFERAKTLF